MGELGEQLNLINALEEIRQSKVLVYFLSTRQGLGCRMAPDALRLFKDHLDTLGDVERLDLFLYTSGGDTLVPHRLTRLILEYAEEFNVLVPYKAHSAGTLLSLGAKRIVMGRMGELGPVDPTTTGPFNPTNPDDQPIGISVEDVTSYLDLAHKRGELNESEGRLGAFQALADKVHPLALGNVNRILKLARGISEKQLALQSDELEEAQMKNIVRHLTSELHNHSYAITRDEAEDLHLPIDRPPNKVEEIMWALYRWYEDICKNQTPFNVAAVLAPHLKPGQFSLPKEFQVNLPEGTDPQVAQHILQQIQAQAASPVASVDVTEYGGFIESSELCHGFVYKGTIRGRRDPSGSLQVDAQLDGTWEQLRPKVT